MRKRNLDFASVLLGRVGISRFEPRPTLRAASSPAQGGPTNIFPVRILSVRAAAKLRHQ